MSLDEFISNAILSSARAIRQLDESLRQEKLGEVWDNDFNTLGEHLASMRITKGKGETEGLSVPVILFEFDLNVSVEEGKRGELKGGISGGGLLKVVTAEFKGSKEESNNSRTVHNLKFCLPVRLTPRSDV